MTFHEKKVVAILIEKIPANLPQGTGRSRWSSRQSTGPGQRRSLPGQRLPISATCKVFALVNA